MRVVRTPTPTPLSQKKKGVKKEVWETYVFDRSPAEMEAAFGCGAGDDGAVRRRRPVLLLECGSVFGTIDTLVKAHPELVTEKVWTSWVGVLAQAGEWLEARGVVRESHPHLELLRVFGWMFDSLELIDPSPPFSLALPLFTYRP